MCVNCVTNSEAVVFQGAAVLTAATQLRNRLGSAPVPVATQQRLADERTVEFLRGLDLDPVMFLPERPAAVAPRTGLAPWFAALRRGRRWASAPGTA